MGHVNMMAAVQPFLSGAISKTVNMPNSSTVEDVDKVCMTAWILGLKAIAIYRDGSKLAQPLQTRTQKSPVREKDGVVTIKNFWPGTTLEFPGKIVPSSEVELELSPVFEQGDQESPIDKLEKIADSALRRSLKMQEDGLARGVREYLPWRRESAYTQKVNINGQSVHLTVGRYPDGRAGEVRLDLSRVGTTLSAVCDMVAMMISIGLQYGVPVEEYVQRLSDRKFEPSGLVEGHENIKYVSSIGDFIARELGLTFLGRTEMGQAKGKPTVEELEKILERNDDLQVVVEPSGEVRTTSRSGLEICPACGEAALTRSGTCQTCTSCGYNDGCGG
jgi:ribonucleoside-diphosphate reductase alpha chain